MALIDEMFAKTFARGDGEVASFLQELFSESRAGHLFLEHSSIKERLQHLLEGKKSPLVEFENSFYLRRNFELETEIITHLKRILESPPAHCLTTPDCPHLYPDQARALELALSSNLTIITGGPGTGKTYLANKIIETFLQQRPSARIIATAPTGKAALRLEGLGIKVGTLHALLGIRESLEYPQNLRPLIGDLIIVDECSMIDLKLWSHLLSAICPGAAVVLMGDAHQLPPVEGGSLFEDICALPAINKVHLNQILRTETDSINALADLVKKGEGEEALRLLNTSQEITLQPLSTFQANVNLTAILTPFQKGPFGTHAINEEVVKSLSPEKRPIIITKNDYHLSLMNGDIGFIEGDKAHFPHKTFPSALLSSFDLAYAISIHKSQGSEFDQISLLLPEGSEVFGRKLLYTAITRAKKSLTLYSSPATLLATIKTVTHSRSNLVKRY